MKIQNNDLTSFTDHLDQQYGVSGTATRDAYESEFGAFKLDVLIEKLGKEE